MIKMSPVLLYINFAIDNGNKISNICLKVL